MEEGKCLYMRMGFFPSFFFFTLTWSCYLVLEKRYPVITVDLLLNSVRNLLCFFYFINSHFLLDIIFSPVYNI